MLEGQNAWKMFVHHHPSHHQQIIFTCRLEDVLGIKTIVKVINNMIFSEFQLPTGCGGEGVQGHVGRVHAVGGGGEGEAGSRHTCLQVVARMFIDHWSLMGGLLTTSKFWSPGGTWKKWDCFGVFSRLTQRVRGL